MTTTPRLTDPLPRRFATDDPGIGGTLKVRPEDFVVEELPLYEPCDEGDHLYLRVQKTSVSHGELMSLVRRRFGQKAGPIGYAGMKDKHAVTAQTISVYMPHDTPDGPIDLGHDRVQVMWAARHRNRIKRGHLSGNRFVIRVRDVDPLHAIRAQKILARLEATGVPAYFGSQRFGYRANNHRLGAMLLRRDWEGVLAELLGTGGATYPEHQHERREAFDRGDLATAAAAWPPPDRAELIASRALHRGAKPRDAVLAIGGSTLGFWTSAYSSAIFNELLDERLERGATDILEPGDVAWKHDSRATFPVDDDLAGSGELPPRLERFEISPTGPLWGRDMKRASGVVDERECALLPATGVDLDTLESSRFSPMGQRRPFRAPIRNVQLEGGFDEHGPHIRIAFDLPRGMYATVAMREVMKSGLGEDDGDDE